MQTAQVKNAEPFFARIGTSVSKSDEPPAELAVYGSLAMMRCRAVPSREPSVDLLS